MVFPWSNPSTSPRGAPQVPLPLGGGPATAGAGEGGEERRDHVPVIQGFIDGDSYGFYGIYWGLVILWDLVGFSYDLMVLVFHRDFMEISGI